MQREEKALEAALDVLISKVTDLKTCITTFLIKLEHENETLNWPTVLDSFALLSGQINSLLRSMKNEKFPTLRNLIMLPLLLSQDRDEELVKLTENRISVFSHEVVPHYLRTKPDPDVESREQQILQRVSQVPSDTGLKQINNMNKISNSILERINTSRETWESEAGARASTAQTSSLNDTNLLISAVTLGKGLKSPSKITPTGNSATPNPQSQQSSLQQISNIGKAPSAIKTNIKAATSIHPYTR